MLISELVFRFKLRRLVFYCTTDTAASDSHISISAFYAHLINLLDKA